jgi:hypothetical protein
LWRCKGNRAGGSSVEATVSLLSLSFLIQLPFQELVTLHFSSLLITGPRIGVLFDTYLGKFDIGELDRWERQANGEQYMFIVLNLRLLLYMFCF